MIQDLELDLSKKYYKGTLEATYETKGGQVSYYKLRLFKSRYYFWESYDDFVFTNMKEMINWIKNNIPSSDITVTSDEERKLSWSDMATFGSFKYKSK